LNILRLDTATHELFIFGKVWSLGLDAGFYMDGSAGSSARVAMQFLLKAVLPWIIVLSIFPLMGTLFGRLFCGWLCPEGSLFELADFLNERILGRREPFNAVSANGGTAGSPRIGWRYAWLALVIYMALPPVLALAFAGYFIAPATIYDRVVSLQFGTGLMAAVVGTYIYVLTTSVFLRHGFCKYICAPGLMQMMFGWISPVSLRIRFDRARFTECTECRRCEEACFMDVRPRAPRRNINCVNCGECVTACRRELGKKGLFAFHFGGNGSVTAPRAGVRN